MSEIAGPRPSKRFTEEAKRAIALEALNQHPEAVAQRWGCSRAYVYYLRKQYTGKNVPRGYRGAPGEMQSPETVVRRQRGEFRIEKVKTGLSKLTAFSEEYFPIK